MKLDWADFVALEESILEQAADLLAFKVKWLKRHFLFGLVGNRKLKLILHHVLQ